MAKPIKHVVVDTETLAVAPNAAVFQIGFTYKVDNVTVTREMTVSPHLFFNPEAKKLYAVDDGTVKFHLKTNPEMYNAALHSDMKLVDLAEFVSECILEAKEDGQYNVWLWACGTDFDMPIIKNLLSLHNVRLGINYTAARDYRTLREMYKEEVPKITKTAHTAGQDSLDQYTHLIEILEYLGKE